MTPMNTSIPHICFQSTSLKTDTAGTKLTFHSHAIGKENASVVMTIASAMVMIGISFSPMSVDVDIVP